MRIIIITGGIGTGKSHAVRAIEDEAAARHVPVRAFSADVVARELRASDAFRQQFPGLSDTTLAEQIIHDKTLRQHVEAYLHKRIISRLLFCTLKAYLAGCAMIVVEAPLWYELRLPHWVYRSFVTMVMLADRQTRIDRLRRRGYSPERIEAFMRMQGDPSVHAQRADIAIRNDRDDPQALRKAVLEKLPLRWRWLDVAVHPVTLLVALPTAILLCCRG